MWYSGIHHISTARTRSVVLLVLFTLFLSFSCNGVFGNRGIHINKLAKKTIQTKYGDMYDCMNYTYDLPVIPPSQPKGSIDQKSSPQFNPSNFWLNGKGCPDGLVPIRRTTKDDLKRAKLATEIHASKYNPLTTDKHGTHTKYGDMYDCMNYTYDLPVIPPSQPKGSIDQKSSPQFNPSNFWLNGKGCPDGLVPIRRTTKDDLKRAKLATEIHASKYNPLTTDKHGTHYAIVGTTDTNAKYHGGYAIISVYQPTVVGTQYSSARIKVQNGPDSIEVGWTVNPTLYKDNRTRLYTFTKTANSACFNTLCNSIKPVRPDMPLDMVLEPVSTINDKYDYNFMLFWDAANGNWRLKVDNDARELGFWPKNIFTALGDGANYVEWGGEVYSPPDLPSPPMGSGSSILETTRYDAYCRLIKTFNETDYAVNAVGTKAFADVNQYQVKDEGDTGEAYFQHLVLFGGPGGYTGP